MTDETVKANMIARRVFLTGIGRSGTEYGKDLSAVQASILWALDASVGEQPDEMYYDTIECIMRATRLSKSAVCRALKELKAMQYMRRGHALYS
jgi:hypothetical protein